MKKSLLLIFATFLLSNVYSQSDLSIINFVNSNHNPFSDITLTPNDNVTPIVWISNNGPDALPAGTTLTFTYFVDEDTLLITTSELDEELTSGSSIYLDAPSFSTNLLIENSLGEYFDLCMSISHVSDSINTQNNVKCLSVTLETSISDIENNGVSIYPNPTSDFIFIDQAAGATIRLYDLNGKEMISFESKDTHCTLSTGNLAAGIYLLQVSQHNEVTNKKISILQ